MRDEAFPAFACATWILAAAVAAAPIQARLNFGLDVEEIGNADPLTRTVGTFKEAVGDLAFLRADSYYHGGAKYPPHVEEDEEHTDQDLEHAGSEHSDHDNHEDHEDDMSTPKDWVSYVYAKITPATDRHARGSDLAEMAPLLAAATKLDPHHVTAILTTAYWLDANLNQAGEAIRVLEEGIRNNPGSWQLDSALGQMLLEKRSDPILAGEHLTSAAQKLSVTPDAERFERRKVWMLLADAYERSGQVKKALQAYRQALTFFDPKDPAAARAHTLSKISRLESSTN